MKKILTRILKRACKRFNIEREDLFDAPDSSARSKSSPREPVAEGDENVDWLALDATKRCTEKKRTMMSGEGVATRSRKRKIAQRDSLWDLIVNNDDICFTHILPRLNSTDVKFLYGVNTETRKLIKRSSRAGDLKKKFNVRRDVVDIDFGSCVGALSVGHVARSGKRWTKHISAGKLLKRINSSCSSGRERRKSVSGMMDDYAAADQGNLEMVKYCVANECPIDEMRVHMLPKTVISSASNTYTKKRKRLGIVILPLGGFKWSSPHTRISC